MIFLNRLKKIKVRFDEIETAISQPDATQNQAEYQKLIKELATLRPIVEAFEQFQKVENDLAELKKSGSEDDAEMAELFREEEEQLNASREKLVEELETLLLRESDPNANRNVILEIRAGTGGEEAALFVADLFRMYSKFASSHDCKAEILSSNSTGIGGFKEMVFSITGAGSYPLFKYESGIHRVQRVPATESSGRIHTSAVTVAVLVEAEEADFEIDNKDLKIDVFRASGAGGQHVNKTESAVRITHIPTGVVVSCQDERSQHKNKAKAMRVLRARLYDAQQQQQAKEMAEKRKAQVGSGDRSGKIRTYNFQDQRVTDHRIGLTLHNPDDILNGHLDELVGALERDERERRLTDAA